ncbi:MAG: hypothetical protein MN733_38990 [Nitrososphaera sp.]|nr:hypothetical protein [Nitrososphaera sp.]
MNTSYGTKLKDFIPDQNEIEEFAESALSKRLISSFPRLLTWIGILNELKGNEQAGILLASAHSKIIEIWALVPLGLIHSAYTCLRTVVDICTGYSFYSSHNVEWNAVCDGRGDWEGRGNIIEWHTQFTPRFRDMNKEFGLVDQLNVDYKALSAFVHGVPLHGLPTMISLERKLLPDKDIKSLIEFMERVDVNLNLMFLTVFFDLTASLSTSNLRTITRGISRPKLARAGLALPRG